MPAPRSTPEPEHPSSDPTGEAGALPSGAVLATSWEVDFGIERLGESLYFSRREGVDELWMHSDDLVGSAHTAEAPISAHRVLCTPTHGDERTGCTYLLTEYVKGSSGMYPIIAVLAGGLVPLAEVEQMVQGQRDARARIVASAEGGESAIIASARELGLGPRPEGTSPTNWEASCPRTNHHLMISVKSQEFGCGYCGRKGGVAELRRFVAERRSR